MPEFKRYPSIESLRNICKLIEKYNPDFDENQKMDWIVSEKLQGANVCVSIDEDGEMDLYSRNGNPLPDGYVSVIRETVDFLISDYKFPDNLKMCIYGEIIGPGIQKGVDYGEEKQFRIFDAYNVRDNVWAHKWDMLRCIKPRRFINEFTSQEIFLSEYIPPSSKLIDKSFNDVRTLVSGRLCQNPNSLVIEKENNVIEGFVVECATMQYITNHTRFKFKMVHPQFRERLKSSSIQRKLEADKVKNDYTIVDEYINENRAQSAISKYPGYTRKQIGDVMKEIVSDVKEDMEKDGKEWHKHYGRRISDFSKKIVVQEADDED